MNGNTEIVKCKHCGEIIQRSVTNERWFTRSTGFACKAAPKSGDPFASYVHVPA